MNDPIPEEEKSRRLATLQEVQRVIQTARHATMIGQTMEVLVSGKSRRENRWSGHASSNRVLNFISPAQDLLGTYVNVRVVDAGPASLIGEHIL